VSWSRGTAPRLFSGAVADHTTAGQRAQRFALMHVTRARPTRLLHLDRATSSAWLERDLHYSISIEAHNEA
jgi:hypothetical protein